MTLHVAGLWRYPVKSFAGEPLTVATLTPEGIPGDRVVHVCGPEGVRTSRCHHRLLGLLGTLGSDGRPRINGHPWDSPEALELIKNAAGDDAWLEADGCAAEQCAWGMTSYSTVPTTHRGRDVSAVEQVRGTS